MFKGCSAVDVDPNATVSHERSLWQHVCSTADHRRFLSKVIADFNLQENYMDLQETACTLLGQAIAEQERRSCPARGMATDRRALAHVGEVFQDGKIQTLVFFICSSKKMCHAGYDKFGALIEKADICYRKTWASLVEGMFKNPNSVSWEYKFCYATFKRKFGQAVRFADDLQDKVFEWRRRLSCRAGHGEAI